MAFFDINNFTNASSSTLNYNYPNVDIWNNSYSALNVTSTSSLIYYKFNYPNANNTSLTYSENGVSTVYTPKRFYLFGVLHNNITGLTSGSNANNNIVGELVIEHTNSSGNTIFSCFFLESPTSLVGTDETSIDLLINMINANQQFQKGSSQYINSVSMNLNNNIPSNQSSFVYKDSIRPLNKVIIFTSPIPLTNKTTISAIKKLEVTTDLFSISAPVNYQSTNNVKPKSSAGESKDGNDIYIDCNPVDASDEQIQTYKVPIVSGVMKKMQDSKLIFFSN
jgi:hypothetical protein